MFSAYKIVRIEERGGETRALLRFYVGEMQDVPYRLTPNDEYTTQSIFVPTDTVALKEITFRNSDVPLVQIERAGNTILAEDTSNTPISEQETLAEVTEPIRAIDDITPDTRTVPERLLFNDSEQAP